MVIVIGARVARSTSTASACYQSTAAPQGFASHVLKKKRGILKYSMIMNTRRTAQTIWCRIIHLPYAPRKAGSSKTIQPRSTCTRKKVPRMCPGGSQKAKIVSRHDYKSCKLRTCPYFSLVLAFKKWSSRRKNKNKKLQRKVSTLFIASLWTAKPLRSHLFRKREVVFEFRKEFVSEDNPLGVGPQLGVVQEESGSKVAV